jgi:hypothetical protein
VPRGNDPTASRDIAAQYGEGHGNAEDLIRAHDDHLDAELNKALLKPVDPAATDALDLDSIKPKYGGTIMNAVIRGGRMVVVEDKDGHYLKWHDDPPGGKKRSGSGKVDAGAEGRKQAAARSQAEADADPGNDGGTGAAGGSPDDDDGDAPEGVTVPMIREKLDARGIVPDREVRRKDDLWALLPADAQNELSGGGGSPS